MSGYRLLLRKEMLELVRTLRLPVVLLVFTILGLISPIFARYVREILEVAGGAEFQGMVSDPVARDAVAQLSRNVGQFGVLITVLVTMGAVAREKERGTAVFLLTKPLGRGAFLGAKLTAIGVLLALATALAGALCWAYTAILFEPLPLAGYAAAVTLLWLSLAVFGAITFAASAMARSALVAGGIGLLALFSGGALTIVPGLGSLLPMGLWTIATDLAVGDVPDQLLGSVVVAVGIASGAICLAWWSFRRQEL